MVFFETYLCKVVKYDLVNTFIYQNLTQIPRLKRIILNFGYQKSNLKYLISGLLALEFVSSRKGRITKSKHLNVFLKIKKGDPVGCKIVLKKSTMYFFYLKLITSIFPKTKQPQTPKFQWDLKLAKSISFQIKTPLLFAELENEFQYFKDTPRLDITLSTNSRSQEELFFLLKSIKFVEKI
jgi:large subunit ribosomal protein L5